MMRTARSLCFATLALVLVTAPASGQLADSTRTQLRDLFGIADNRNWYLRVLTADELQLEGTVIREPGDAVRVGSATVPFESIRTVHRRTFEGGGSGSGIKVGGVSGGILGLLLAFGLCSLGEGRCDMTYAAIGGIAGGAAFGAVVGGLAGSLFNPGEPVWVLEWPTR